MINHRIIGQGLLSLKGIMIQIKKKQKEKTKNKTMGNYLLGNGKKKKIVFLV